MNRLEQACVAQQDSNNKMLCSQVLVMAIVTNTVAECNESVKLFVSNNHVNLDEFVKHVEDDVKKVFYPVEASGGISFQQQEIEIEEEETGRMEVQQSKTSPEKEGKMKKLLGSKENDDEFILPLVKLSPNMMALFCEQSLKPVYGLSSPYVNHRNLSVNRVWNYSFTEKNENQGIIATLLGVQQTAIGYDKSLSKVSYMVVPYKAIELRLVEGVATSSNISTSSATRSQYIFSHDKHREILKGAEHLIKKDLEELVNLLTTVSHKG
jgi:hypothetical protein